MEETIPGFYRNKDIFITGGTGFMGKVLIEKLLRSCSDINKIFILMRSKKGMSIEERIEQMKSLPLFDVIKKENPKVLNKMVPVEGDVMEIGLGMSDETRRVLENVSIIFHSAASVRFDDPLKYAILLNTRGTLEACKFATTLSNLEAFVHVSTAYSNPHHRYVKEVIYPPHGNWRDVIKLAENLDELTLDIFMKKLTDYMPNTYTYTKGMAEQICDYYMSRLPMVIFRPAIVTGTEREPFPGWCDNLNGPVGLLIACGFGVLRTTYASRYNLLDCIAVDIAIKAMIASAWSCGLSNKNENNNNNQPLIKEHNLPTKVYNCASLHKIALGFLVGDGRDFIRKTPFSTTFWTANGGVTECKFMNYLRMVLVQILPALLCDSILQLSGRKPFLMRIQRKITNAVYCLRYFTINQWHIANNNFLELTDMILPADRESFDLRRKVIDTKEYYTLQILGARRYILKESDDTIPAARKRFERMIVIDRVLKTILTVLIIYCIYSFIFKKFLL